MVLTAQMEYGRSTHCRLDRVVADWVWKEEAKITPEFPRFENGQRITSLREIGNLGVGLRKYGSV